MSDCDIGLLQYGSLVVFSTWNLAGLVPAQVASRVLVSVAKSYSEISLQIYISSFEKI